MQERELYLHPGGRVQRKSDQETPLAHAMEDHDPRSRTDSSEQYCNTVIRINIYLFILLLFFCHFYFILFFISLFLFLFIYLLFIILSQFVFTTDSSLFPFLGSLHYSQEFIPRSHQNYFTIRQKINKKIHTIEIHIYSGYHDDPVSPISNHAKSNVKCSDRQYDPGIRAEENTVMIGGIDPEPRCWNSKSLLALN